jgi:hypothetical protein
MPPTQLILDSGVQGFQVDVAQVLQRLGDVRRKRDPRWWSTVTIGWWLIAHSGVPRTSVLAEPTTKSFGPAEAGPG